MPTVLVADDNSNIQKMVALALEDQGISVVAVGNGEAAVRKLGEVNPDVVLADVFMPVRNGYEVCEFVKKDSRFAHVPVILLIGAFDPFDENEARRVGANGVLKKPFVPPDPLIAMVTGFVSGLEKQPAAPAPAVEEQRQPPKPPVSSAAPDFEPAAEPVTESAAEEFTVGRGPLSLRDEEDREAKEPAAPPVSELPSEEHWEERIANWRREAIGYEIPSDIGEPSAELSESETTSSAFPPVESAIVEETTHTEASQAASEPVGPALTRNPAEWLEMMSPSKQASSPEPEPPLAAPPAHEVECRRSIFHPERVVPQEPPASLVSEEAPADPETVIPFPARTEAEAQPEPVEEHAEPQPKAELPQTYGHVESELQQETLPAEHPVETSSEAVTFEPQPTPELFGFIQPSSYAGGALETEGHAAPEAEERSHVPTQEQDLSGSHVESYSAPASLDPGLVDAVVNKVLERIEPQLRNILTRELLRPLAESLLERELQKK